MKRKDNFEKIKKRNLILNNKVKKINEDLSKEVKNRSNEIISWEYI